MKIYLTSTFVIFCLLICGCAYAEGGKPLTGAINDPFVYAQEKLLHAKGSYKTIKQQENAIESMRRATGLGLKAAKLRAKAERLQNRSDLLLNKANQQALSRGVYITNPLAPVMMQPPPTAPPQFATQQAASAPAFAPVPGQPINIIVPRQEEISSQSEDINPFPVQEGY